MRFGLVVLAVLIACSLIRLLPKKARLPVLLLLMVLVLAFGWFFPGQQNGSVLREFHEILHGRPQFAFGAGRIGVWTYTLKMLETGDRLLFGSGADTFAMRFSAFLKTFYEEHPDAEHLTKYYDTPHSEYLALCVNCGLPALLFFLSLVIGGCLTASPWRDSVLSYALQAAFSFSVCIVAPIFWVILGLAWTSPPDSAADH